MSIEVPIPEGDEARSLTQEELGQGQEDHCWFSHESTCTTSVSPKTLKMFDSLTKLFEDKNLNQNMALRKQLKNVKIQNAEVVIATLNGLPGSWIHSCKEFVLEGSNYFQQTLGRRRSSMEAIEDQALTIQRRSLKRWGIWRTQFLKNPLSILSYG